MDTAGRRKDAAVLIRDALPADLPRIVEIYNAAIPGRRATADTEPISVTSRVAWFHEHARDSHPLWVAEAADATDAPATAQTGDSLATTQSGDSLATNSHIAGWLSFQPFYGRPAYRHTAELSVYVAPSGQQRGVGTALVGRAIERAPGLGLKTLLGFVFGHNDPSLALFGSFGFRPWGTLPRVAELDDVERDLVILGIRLGD